MSLPPFAQALQQRYLSPGRPTKAASPKVDIPALDLSPKTKINIDQMEELKKKHLKEAKKIIDNGYDSARSAELGGTQKLKDELLSTDSGRTDASDRNISEGTVTEDAEEKVRRLEEYVDRLESTIRKLQSELAEKDTIIQQQRKELAAVRAKKSKPPPQMRAALPEIHSQMSYDELQNQLEELQTKRTQMERAFVRSPTRGKSIAQQKREREDAEVECHRILAQISRVKAEMRKVKNF